MSEQGPPKKRKSGRKYFRDTGKPATSAPTEEVATKAARQNDLFGLPGYRRTHIREKEIISVMTMSRMDHMLQAVKDFKKGIVAAGPIQISMKGLSKSMRKDISMSEKIQRHWNTHMLEALRKCLDMIDDIGFVAVTVVQDPSDTDIVMVNVVAPEQLRFDIMYDENMRPVVSAFPKNTYGEQVPIHVYVQYAPTPEGHLTSPVSSVYPVWEVYKRTRANTIDAETDAAHPPVFVQHTSQGRSGANDGAEMERGTYANFPGQPDLAEQFSYARDKAAVESAVRMARMANQKLREGGQGVNMDTGDIVDMMESSILDKGFDPIPSGMTIARHVEPRAPGTLQDRENEKNVAICSRFSIPMGFFHSQTNARASEELLLQTLRNTIARERSMVESLARWLYQLSYGDRYEREMVAMMQHTIDNQEMEPGHAFETLRMSRDVDVVIGTAPTASGAELIAAMQTGVMSAEGYAEHIMRGLGLRVSNGLLEERITPDMKKRIDELRMLPVRQAECTEEQGDKKLENDRKSIGVTESLGKEKLKLDAARPSPTPGGKK